MNKILGLSGITLAAFFALAPANVFAANSTVTVNGSEDLYVVSGTRASSDGSATYTAASKTLTLNNYTGSAIESDVDGLKISLTGTNTINTSADVAIKSTGSLSINGGGSLKTTGAVGVSNGNLNVENVKITARSLAINDEDSSVQNKITIGAKTELNLSGSISARYNFAISEKGVLLSSSICTNPTAQVANIKSGNITTSTLSTDGSTSLKGIKASAAICADTDAKNPDTFDAIYLYAALLVVSSAIFASRRYLARH